MGGAGRTLLTLAVMLAAAWLGGRGAERLGQPRVVGELVAGIVLGPSLLGAAWPGATAALFPPAALHDLKPVADVGLVLFMFATGAGLDTAVLRHRGRQALVISAVSVAVPMAGGLALAAWMHPRFAPGVETAGFALFTAAAMAVTALPVLARILHDTGLRASRLGTVALACAAFDDVTAWAAVAAVTAMVRATGPAGVVRILGLTAVFTVAALAVVRPALRRLRRPLPLPALVALALGGAAATDAIGTHAVFGAFVMGVAAPTGTRAWRTVDRAVLPVLLPVFFISVGLMTRIDALTTGTAWLAAAAVLVVAVAGKFGGSLAAARATGLGGRRAAALAVLLNAGGVTELVVLEVGLELGVIERRVFAMFVLMALATTVMTAPALRLVLGPDPAAREAALD